MHGEYTILNLLSWKRMFKKRRCDLISVISHHDPMRGGESSLERFGLISMSMSQPHYFQ